MYAIIYWDKSNEIFPVLNPDETLKLFVNIEDADKYANDSLGSVDCRVISIDGVKE